MRLPLYVLAVGGGTLVQSTLAPIFGVGGVVPDLPILLVVLLALRRGPEVGCLIGFALGLAQDVVAGGPLGLHALTKALVGFVAGGLPRWCVVTNPVVPIAMVVLATVAGGVLRWGVLQFFHYPAPLDTLVAAVLLPQAGYNGLLAAAIVVWPGTRTRG